LKNAWRFDVLCAKVSNVLCVLLVCKALKWKCLAV